MNYLIIKMASSEEQWVVTGHTLIEGLIKEWTRQYKHIVKFTEKNFNDFKYTVEFSKPTYSQPVPSVTVKVHFTIPYHCNNSEITFTFENESLRHRPGHTLRTPQMERWIDRIYNNKTMTRQLMDLGTPFENMRILAPDEEENDSFYEGCSLLESTLGEISYHDEVDDGTNSIYELMLRYLRETLLPEGATKTKQRIPRITRFNAIAQVIGKSDESPKRGGEKTHEQKLVEFYKLYPHIGECEARLGELQLTAEHTYYYEPDENGTVAKCEVDQTVKKHPKEATLLETENEDGNLTEYIYKGQ